MPLLLAAIAAASAFADVPGARVVRYGVTGRDAGAIAASMRANGPVDPNDGEPVAAITNWRFTWQWPGTAGADDCDLSRATVRFAATVTLPWLRAAATLPPDLRATWRRYGAAVAAHEGNHLRYAYAHRGEVLAAIRGATCATAEAAGQAVLARLAEHDLAYDRDTRHGATEGATFP